MILRYGTYTHADNECVVVISRDGNVGQDGRLVSVRERWDVQGQMHANTAALLTTSLRAMERAYAVDAKDILLLMTGGGVSAHSMLSINTIQGTRVVQPPSYPIGSGAEYTTFRHYALAVEGETAIKSRDPILSWREGISRRGTGGPRWTYQFPVVGGPVKQYLSQYTPVTIVQEGEATGDLVYPPPPAPLWPSEELVEERQISQVVPSKASRERRITWSYTFLSYTTLNGLPTVR